ncbi:glycosyltransferase family 2 protein [Gaoshiqia sediminis]|uniref:Glycosyltransferase n=1 Tax=Gaoshiqia sediminis TaxID=2986998 RepID=A0AA41Y7A7_9BACT|nr:glycosyltransferase family 2 protein [Gaoshiqia sediminis]MCW0484739.1 glycosyltransferase [Gaoshiqia sediminis]
MSDTVAAIVVTYNRKDLLIVCLEALRNQTRKPDAIYIIDNKSTDGTPELLVEKGYIDQLPDINSTSNQVISHNITWAGNHQIQIRINYIRKFENDGGAGGFYEGMKQAYDTGYDWIWMMDDDGMADQKQLEHLLLSSNTHRIDFANALVVDINETDKLAFGLKNYKYKKEIVEKDVITNEINPFNGTLIRRSVPERIGFIKREMFIWGDENEYFKRANTSKITIATVINSIHYHPPSKSDYGNVFPFTSRYRVLLKPNHFSQYYYRNIGYINWKYSGRKDFWVTAILYCLYFLKLFRIRELVKFVNSYADGKLNQYKS